MGDGATRTTCRRVSKGNRGLRTRSGRMVRHFCTRCTPATHPVWLREVPAVAVLRRVWVQNYWHDEDRMRFRTEAEGIPKAAHVLSSPHDTDAHLSKKHATCWVGYKVHLTETCEEDGTEPHHAMSRRPRHPPPMEQSPPKCIRHSPQKDSCRRRISWTRDSSTPRSSWRASGIMR